MAIFVCEERGKMFWLPIVLTVGVVILIFVGAYYLFFKQPQLLDLTAPTQVQKLTTISKINYDPSTVINSPAFRMLTQYNQLPSASTAGRPNPFLPSFIQILPPSH